MFRNALQPWHLLMVGLVIAVVFGSKKLPDTARALGKSLRILKSEARAMREEDATANPPQPATHVIPGPPTPDDPPHPHTPHANPAPTAPR